MSMRLLRRLIGLSLLSAVTSLLNVESVYAQVLEYQVKAAMIVKLTWFVEWPTQAFSSPDAPFVICAIGQSPLNRWLKPATERVLIQDRKPQVRELNNPQSTQDCHLILINRSERPHLQQRMSTIKTKETLVISDMEDNEAFCRQGGMIGFVIEGGKVRFDLNNDAIKKAGLSVESQLMSVARTAYCGR